MSSSSGSWAASSGVGSSWATSGWLAGSGLTPKDDSDPLYWPTGNTRDEYYGITVGDSVMAKSNSSTDMSGCIGEVISIYEVKPRSVGRYSDEQYMWMFRIAWYDYMYPEQEECGRTLENRRLRRGVLVPVPGITTQCPPEEE